MRTSEEQAAAEVIFVLQELLALTEAAQIFEQISQVAVVKMCNIDWTGITVRRPGQLEVPVQPQPQTSTVTDQDLHASGSLTFWGCKANLIAELAVSASRCN